MWLILHYQWITLPNAHFEQLNTQSTSHIGMCMKNLRNWLPQWSINKTDTYKEHWQYLESLGWGSKFLVALQCSMAATGIIGSETFDTTSEVKQGGSSSVKLFTAYIYPTIDAVDSLGPNVWMEKTHILLLMDENGRKTEFSINESRILQSADILQWIPSLPTLAPW